MTPGDSAPDVLLDRPGEAAALMRARDWSQHPLGAPATWPIALRLSLARILNAPHSMYLVWGTERTFFFNDAYIPILGPRLAAAMGARFEELWADAWPTVAPAFLKAEAGEHSLFQDMLVPMARYGVPEQTWWTFSYSAVEDESGRIVGVLCYTIETTEHVQAALDASAEEARNRQILDSATDFAVIATDLDGRVTRWNEGAHRVLGWSEAEMLGETADRFFTPEDLAADRPGLEKREALTTGRATDERWHQRKDGQRFWAAGEMTLLRAADGDIVGFVKVLRDRTEQRLTLERLEESQSRLAEALTELHWANETLYNSMEATVAERDRMWETSPDLLHVITTDGILEKVNPAWTTILGYAPEDLVGTPARPLLHPDDVAAYDAALIASASETLPPLINRLRHKDGSYRWFSWLSAPAGEVIYAFGRHITAEREGREALRDTQHFARLALSAIGGVGVWTYDVASDTFVCDAAISALYGLDPERGAAGLKRPDFLANVHPDDLAALRATMAGGMVSVGDIELEYRILHPDGSIRWVLSRGHTYFDANGVAERRTGIGVDRTAQRLLEEQLRQSQKVEAVGQLTGGVAHDFNNLLTVIRGSVDLLRRPEVSEERRKRYVDAISDTADRATKLTSQLLAFARRQALTPETFDAAQSVLAIRDMLVTLTGPRIRIVVEAGDAPCFIDADRSQFDTAIVNIAINARDAMNGEGTLTIRIAPISGVPAVRAHLAIPGAFVEVAISDTGAGIAPDKLDQIFEPFFTTKEVGQGTGLGLSQVYGFAKQSGGDIIATNGAEGAIFTLYLPHVPEGTVPKVAAETLGPALRPGACILVVEDNPEVGSFATQALDELGYKTRFVPDANAALETLADHPTAFDAVFSDVLMPGMTGIELGQEIARLYPTLPVILTSGYSAVLAESGTHGFDLLHKPYSIDELARVLGKVAGTRLL